jgi:hypothetical protein
MTHLTRGILALAILTGLTVGRAGAVPIQLCNTGQPLGCSGTLADGTLDDPNYDIIAGPAAFVGNAKVVIGDGYPIGPWLANAANSKWIGPAAATANSGADDPDNAGYADYVYQTTFSLAGLDPLTAVINGFWAVDNTGLDILINGISTGQITNGIAGDKGEDFGFLAYTPFTITSGFQPGLNTLGFVVRNAAYPMLDNPTGLRVDMTGTAEPLSVTQAPEPGTFVLVGTALAGLAKRRHSQRKKRAGRDAIDPQRAIM